MNATTKPTANRRSVCMRFSWTFGSETECASTTEAMYPPSPGCLPGKPYLPGGGDLGQARRVAAPCLGSAPGLRIGQPPSQAAAAFNGLRDLRSRAVGFEGPGDAQG